MDPKKKRDRNIRQGKWTAHEIWDHRKSDELILAAIGLIADHGQGKCTQHTSYTAEALRILADKLEAEEKAEDEQIDAEEGKMKI